MRHSPSVTKATSCSAPSGVTAPAILVRGDPFPSCLPLAQPWMTRRPKDPSLQMASSPTQSTAYSLSWPWYPWGALSLSHVYLWHLLLFTLLPQAGSDEWHCRRSFLGYSIWLIRVSSPVGKRLGRKRQYLGCYRTGCLGSSGPASQHHGQREKGRHRGPLRDLKRALTAREEAPTPHPRPHLQVLYPDPRTTVMKKKRQQD